jgi:hypothetical protein
LDQPYRARPATAVPGRGGPGTPYGVHDRTGPQCANPCLRGDRYERQALFAEVVALLWSTQEHALETLVTTLADLHMRFDTPIQTMLNILVSVGWIAAVADILRRPSAQFRDAQLNKCLMLFCAGAWWPLFPFVRGVPLPVGLALYVGYVFPRLGRHDRSQPDNGM